MLREEEEHLHDAAARHRAGGLSPVAVLAWTSWSRFAAPLLSASFAAVALFIVASAALVERWFVAAPATTTWPLLAAPLAVGCMLVCGLAAAWVRNRRGFLLLTTEAVRLPVLLAALAAALAVPATAFAAGKVFFEDTVPAGKSNWVEIRTQKAASFRVLLRVPTQGRAQLFLSGKTAPRGGPLIDTKTYACEGVAGSFYCRAAYEPLPKGAYRWRIRWLGAKPAHVELTVRW